jgi:hypothetical protein
MEAGIYTGIPIAKLIILHFKISCFDVWSSGNNFYPYSILDIVLLFNKAIFRKE